MVAILGIAVAAALALLVTGVLASVAIAPARTHLGPEVPAAGLVVLILLAYPVYQFTGATIATPTVIGGVVLMGVVAAIRWLRLEPAERRIPLPSRALVATVVIGGVTSLILLIPILRAGFPTTVGWMNWDAWGYAGTIEWLQNHGARGATADPLNPVSFPAWSNDSLGFPIGIESVLASLAFVTRRLGFEAAGPALALGGLVATSGWMTLALASGLRRPGWLVAVAAAVAGLSPMVLVTSVQVYANQFVSLSLWPFAVGLTMLALRRPAASRCIAAGAALGAVMSVYPTMLIWTLPAVIGVAIGAVWFIGWTMPAVKSVALALVAVGVVAVVVAPLQLATAIHNLLFVSGKTGNPGFAELSGRTLTEIGLGTWFPIGDAKGWTSLALTIVVVIGIGLAAALLADRSARSAWIPLVVAVALPGAAIATIYTTSDPYPYGAYKAIVTGGALVMGVVVVCLAAHGERRPGLAGVGVTLIAVAWIPQVSGLLESASSEQGTGFRAADVRTIRALGTLPGGSTTLVDGAGESPAAFRARMMMAYGASASAVGPVVGLGTTGSYLTGGGLDQWMPRKPWDYTVTYEGVPLLARPGSPVWSDPPYAIWRAPRIDVTPWGAGWYPTEQFNGTPYAWLSKPAWLLVSNRTARTQRVRLSMVLVSAGIPREALIRGGKAATRAVLPRDQQTSVTLSPVLPARSVTRVHITASPATPVQVSPSDPRLLMLMVAGVKVETLT